MKRICWLLVFSCPIMAQWQAMEVALTGSSSSFGSTTGHSWADVDGDGDFDLFLNGSQILWLNKVNETGTFVSGNAMLPAVSGSGWAACFGDFDNDGDPDIFCGNSGVDFLLQNNWPANFTNVAPTYQITDDDWCQSVNWADYNKDGLLDIYITHEVPGGDGPHEFYQNDYPNPFIPRFPTGANPDTFGLADRNSHAYGLTWADVDIDGDLDVVTSACGSASQIPNEDPHNKVYLNQFPIDSFKDVSLQVGLVDAPEVMNGSDAYWATLFDYDGDAFPDLFIGDNGGNHRLWRNTGTLPGEFGLSLVSPAVHNLSGNGAFLEGACAGDWDNDGDLDLYTTTDGLFENDGAGGFSSRSDLVGPGRTDASFVDYDLDGNLDLFHFGDLYRNPGYGNHWISIELEGDPTQGTTRSAHHVKIRVTAGGLVQYREHRFMVGTYSQHMLPTHFGLASNNLVEEIQVTWPNGSMTTLEKVSVDQYIRIVQSLDCSGDLNTAKANFTGCAGDAFEISASSSTASPVRWVVLSGPDTNSAQFLSPSALTTTFIPSTAGNYQLGLTYDGCFDYQVQVAILSSDYNGDENYNSADFAVVAPLWQTQGDISTVDWNQDGSFDVRDYGLWCHFNGAAKATISKMARSQGH